MGGRLYNLLLKLHAGGGRQYRLTKGKMEGGKGTCSLAQGIDSTSHYLERTRPAQDLIPNSMLLVTIPRLVQ